MASEIFRKIGFDASDAIAQLNALGAAVNEAGRHLSNFDRSAAFRGASNLGKGLQEAQGQMVRFSDGSTKAVRSLDELVQGARNAQQGIPQMGNALKRSGEQAKQASGFFSRVGKSLKTILATRAIIGALGAVTNALRSTTREAREFGLAVAEIQTIGGQLNQSSQAISQRVLDLSSALGTDAIDTARGLYQVLSNQVVEAGESFQFLEQAQKLAITTVASTADAVDALSSVMNAYGMSASDTAHVSDTLFEAVNVGRFVLSDIADILGRVTPLTAQMGISWEETAAAIATMTQSGVRADTAITQLRAVVVKLLKPTEAMQALYEKWGVKDGPTAIKTFGGLQGVLQKIAAETNGSTTEMTAFFNEVRGLAGALGLNIDNGERFTKVLGQIENSAGRASEAFQGFQASQAQQLTIEMNKLKNEIIQLGTALQPVTTSITRLISNNVQFIREAFQAVYGIYNEGAGLAQRNQARLIAAQKENEAAVREFTGFTSDEYKKREEAFLRSLAEQQKGFNRFVQSIGRAQEVLTDKFKGLGRTLLSSFGDAIKDLENRVNSFGDRIQESVNKTKDIQLEIDEEKLRQDLDKAFSPTQKFKILDQEASKRELEALNALRRAGTTEEVEAAQALADRAVKAQRAREEAAQQLGLTRDEKDAQSDILRLLEAKKKSQEGETKRAQDQRKAEVSLLAELKKRETELKTLISQRNDAINNVIESRGKEREAALKTLEEIDGKLKQLGFSRGEFNLFKTFDGEDSIKNFNDALSQLDTARIDWTAAVQQLELKLAKIRVGVELQTPGGQAGAFAEQLGLDFDPNDIVGTAAKVTEESKKILKERDEAATKFQGALKIEDTLQQNINDGVATLNKLLVDAQTNQLSAGELASITWTKVTQGAQAAANQLGKIAMQRFPELAKLPQELDKIRDLISTGDLAGAREAINSLKQPIDNLKQTGQLNQEQYDALNEFLGSTLSQTIDNLDAKTGTYKRTLDELKPKAEIADAWLQIVERAGGAEARARGMLSATNQLPGAAQGAANNGWKLISDEALRGRDAAAEIVETTGTIGPTAANQVGGINAATQAMTALKNEAIAAAQATAAATSGAPAAAAPGGSRFGRYFARGGLASLRPMGTDTIPAMIARGEFVTNARSSRKFFSELNAINQDRKPVYRREGGSVTEVGDINVTVQGGDTSRQTVRAIAAELNRELKRGTIRLGSLRKA